ncbi:MAG: hypothetical protein M3461_02510 [Pseudomonadota bacterium]|nr:hypothetical protein [Pseudomonadota bacterium]
MADSLDCQRRALDGCRLLQVRHAHDLIGHTVGLALVLVTGAANGERGLDELRAKPSRSSPVAGGSLEVLDLSARFGST